MEFNDPDIVKIIWNEANKMIYTSRNPIPYLKIFRKELELHGVGYRASNKGQTLDLSLGYSHNIVLQICDEVVLKTETEKGKNPKIILESYDKELIGAVAAKIKSLRKHDPYKGKGIRFVGERGRRKAGKTASS